MAKNSRLLADFGDGITENQEVTKEMENGYANLLIKLCEFPLEAVMNTDFVVENQLAKFNKVAVIEGKDFNLRLAGYTDYIPKCLNFKVYVFPSRISG